VAKPNAKKGFLLRLPQPLFDELRRWAGQDMRSINGQIEWILRDAVKKRGRRVDDVLEDGERVDNAVDDDQPRAD
tara:strand:+ start:185 stop:409 length:225 start_codon:yes stop_codon:yes gene_type:complete